MITNFKIFEENNIPNFKKYVVWRYLTGYAIFELLTRDSYSGNIRLKHLYQYEEDTNQLRKTEKQEEERELFLAIDETTSENFKKYGIYQSDNLESCLNFLDSFSDSKKYNI